MRRLIDLWGWYVPALLVYWMGCAPQPAVRRPQPPPPPVDSVQITQLVEPEEGLEYFYYPAVFDTVQTYPRFDMVDSTAWKEGVPVEVLIKGALPDACTELHQVRQERYGHLIRVELLVRRPKRKTCVSVARPYKFYLRLEGRYPPGHYTLRVNDRVFPFEVRVPQSTRS